MHPPKSDDIQTRMHIDSTDIYIILPPNVTLSQQSTVFVRFNQSTLPVAARITPVLSIMTVCPPSPRPGIFPGQVLMAETGRVVAEFKLAYVWPAAEVFPAKVPMSGANLTMKVRVCACVCVCMCVHVRRLLCRLGMCPCSRAFMKTPCFRVCTHART
jgi:hypothetical protein